MKLIKHKITELIEKSNNLKEDNILNEIKSNLIELQKEIENYREIEIYKEDFSDVSWSYVTENNNLKSIIAYTIN